MLCGFTPLDPPTFIGVPLLFGLVAIFAPYVLARHATKVDPLVTPRHDE
jgi:hypothetical protein